MENYSFSVIDTETTSLSLDGDIIELSIYRLEDDNPETAQKTWCFRPLNTDKIDPNALRVNGHKLEDLLWKTKEGREKYREPSTVLPEIENFIAEGGLPAERNCIVGHNAGFDKVRMEILWTRCNSLDTFPFGRRFIDTMTLELALDYAKGQFAEGYALSSLGKKYGVKNLSAHTASSDVLTTKQIFEKQIKYLRELICNGTI